MFAAHFTQRGSRNRTLAWTHGGSRGVSKAGAPTKCKSNVATIDSDLTISGQHLTMSITTKNNRNISRKKRSLRNCAIGLNLLLAVPCVAATPFQRFIENPPVIAELIYSVETVVAGNTNSEHFQIKWQQNAAFLRKLKSVDDARTTAPSPDANFTSYFDQKVWQFDTENGYTVANADDARVLVNLGAKIDYAGIVMNGGVADVPIGSIRWTNNQFSVLSRRGPNPNGPAVTVTGFLESDDQGRPQRLTVERRLGQRAARGTINYSAHMRIGKALDWPREIVYRVGDDQPPKLLRKIIVHALETSDSELPESYFDPTAFAVANSNTLRVIEGGVIFFTNKQGLKQVIGSVPAPAIGRRGLVLFVIFLTCMVAVTTWRWFAKSKNFANVRR